MKPQAGVLRRGVFMAEGTSDTLEEIVKRLAAEFNPEEIILFGSHAWGTPAADSDIDVLVIVSDSNVSPTRRAAKAHQCLQGIAASKDVLVKTREEFEKYRPVPASLEAQILRRGRVVYASSKSRARPELVDQS